ncbi:hypothetical protein L6164_035039 [Bauhinia variegata]|uniref:Uncharacterized protein n=1 Tax=Bauhinia variegata TaxID=167791 RepID=A0ACB9KWD9_BAUVA|nr:hypothetical protein L6164_035039 [Bauhinia variegata]
MGKYAADQLYLAAPDSPAPYILMANIDSNEGKWKERARSIKRMKELGVAKVGIYADIIYLILSGLLKHMNDEGYVLDQRYILYYLGQDENVKPPSSF